MFASTHHTRLALLFCASVLPCISAHAEERTRITLRGKQADVKSLAMLMQAQPAGAHLRIAVDTLPSLTRLLRLLPRGTRHKGNTILLPNGSDYVLARAKTLAQEKAAFEAQTETRQELIARLQQLKGSAAQAIVKVKRPADKSFVSLGTLEQGIEEVPYLPSGTYPIAVVPTTKAVYQFYRIAGRPTLPQAHDGKNPGLRWTQQANGRWEEVTTTTHTGLHWAQRTDGYWEEAPGAPKKR